MKHTIICLILGLMLVISLTGCRKDEAPNVTPTPSPVVTPTPEVNRPNPDGDYSANENNGVIGDGGMGNIAPDATEDNMGTDAPSHNDNGMNNNMSGNGMDNAGDAIGDMVEGAGDTVGDIANGVGNAARDIGNSIGNAMK